MSAPSTPTARGTTGRTGPARATDRFEFRIKAEAKATISAAAAALGVDTSDFAREVLLERATQVLAERAAKTVVPASFFDDLVAAMDAPVTPNPALRRAMAAARANIAADHLHP